MDYVDLLLCKYICIIMFVSLVSFLLNKFQYPCGEWKGILCSIAKLSE